MQKYYLDENDTLKYYSRILKRIIYTKEFLDSINDIYLKHNLEISNAYIESYDNLSQDDLCVAYGNAKIFKDAKVYDNARIYDEAKLRDNSQVYDEALVFGYVNVCNNAKIYEEAVLFDIAKIYDNSQIYGKARVHGNAQVRGNARVYGRVEVSGNTKVLDNARIFGCANILDDTIIDKNIWVYKNNSLLILPSKIHNTSELKGEESEDCKECEFYNECHFDEIED